MSNEDKHNASLDASPKPQKAFESYLSQAPNTLCLYPVSHLNFKNDGAMSCCFRAENLGHVRENNIEAFWNSHKFKEIRKNMTRGVRSPECVNCWRMEDSGGTSYRQDSLADSSTLARWRNQFEDLRADGEMPFRVKQAELRFSNICNLQCRMCSPAFSTKWSSEMTQKTPLWKWLYSWGYHRDLEERMTKNPEPTEKVLEFIRNSAPYLEELMITGGEPFIDTSHIEALEILQPYAHNVTLEYTTNLNALTKGSFNVLDHWEKFKQIRLKVSVDGDREIYNYVRHGGDINLVLQNMKRVREKFPVGTSRPGKLYEEEKVLIIGTCTVSAYNIGRLDTIAQFITQMGALFHTSQVNYPQFQSSRILSPEAKAKITERLNEFSSSLDDKLDWEGNAMWLTSSARNMQKRRIQRFIKNSLSYMNGGDLHAKHFDQFLEFEKLFNESKNIPDEKFQQFLRDSYLS